MIMEVVIDQPKHRRVYEELRRRVIGMAPGSRLDSVRNLMRNFAVSQITVTKALESLRQDGLLGGDPGNAIMITDEVLKYRDDALPIIAIALPRWDSNSFLRVENEFMRQQKHCQFIGEVLHFDWQDNVIRELPPRKIDALMVMPAAGVIKVDQIQILNSFNIPYLIYGQRLQDIDVSSVSTDSEYSASMIADHFIKNGHKKLAVMITEPRIEIIEDRVKGFVRYCKLQNLSVEVIDCHIKNGDHSTKITYEKTKELLSKGMPQFTALFAISENPCMGIFKALHESGIRIPEDISIASIGDNENSEFYYPALTTIAAGLDNEISTGVTILKKLLAQGWNANTAAIKKCIESRLLIRESTSKCSR